MSKGAVERLRRRRTRLKVEIRREKMACDTLDDGFLIFVYRDNYGGFTGVIIPLIPSRTCHNKLKFPGAVASAIALKIRKNRVEDEKERASEVKI